MKKLIRYSLAFLLLAFLYGLYSFVLSSEARIGTMNQRNSYKIRKGMHTQEVIGIMGAYGEKMQQDSFIVYQYIPHPFASSNVSVTFTRDGIVESVGHGD